MTLLCHLQLLALQYYCVDKGGLPYINSINMKKIILLTLFLLEMLHLSSQKETLVQPALSMQKVTTSIGSICIYTNEVQSQMTPIIFLHGLYFDYHMWDYQIEKFADRKVIAVDMPFHGNSTQIFHDKWSLESCTEMLFSILDSLNLSKVIAVGHSWGGMTILRACLQNPDRFESICLFNTPFKSLNDQQIGKIKRTHAALIFKKLYINEAAKALFSKLVYKNNKEVIHSFKESMGVLSNKQIRFLDKIVRIEPEDLSLQIKNIKVPYIFVAGKEDYVGLPEVEHAILIDGGHCSPVEDPVIVNNIINDQLNKY